MPDPVEPPVSIGLDDEGRITRSWRLTREAAALLRGDRTTAGLAVGPVLFSFAAPAAIFWLAGWPGHGHTGRLLRISALAAWPTTFVGVFLNVALAAAAAAALDGERLTAREALAVPVARAGQIAVWSLLAAGVGVLLHEVASRVPFGGRLASFVLGAAWGLVTFFAIPVLALEGCTATGCVRRSARLIEARWGEGVSGTLTISAWLVLASIPAGLLVGVGFACTGAVEVVLVAIGVLLIAVAGTVSTAVRQVFAVALDRYAVGGDAQGFASRDLERPFTEKRCRW